MAGDVVTTWRDELDELIVRYGLMCAFGSSTDMMKAKAEIDRHVAAHGKEGVKACETEQDCTRMPACRIEGHCREAVDAAHGVKEDGK